MNDYVWFNQVFFTDAKVEFVSEVGNGRSAKYCCPGWDASRGRKSGLSLEQEPLHRFNQVARMPAYDA